MIVFLTVNPNFAESVSFFPVIDDSLQNLTKMGKISWCLTKFNSIILWFHSLLLHFINFQWFWKFTANFQSCLDWFKFGKFWTWQWRKLKNQYHSYYNKRRVDTTRSGFYVTVFHLTNIFNWYKIRVNPDQVNHIQI
jgi:hypothetical protein